MSKGVVSRDKERVEQQAEAYPRRYVEECFASPDAVAGQRAPVMKRDFRSYS